MYHCVMSFELFLAKKLKLYSLKGFYSAIDKEMN